MANRAANQDITAVMKTISAGVRVFHESPKFRVGHVVLMGWGNGARFVYQAARTDRRSTAASCSTARSRRTWRKIGKFAAPLCAVYPNNDPAITHESVQVFERMMKDSGTTFPPGSSPPTGGWSNPASKTYKRGSRTRKPGKSPCPFSSGSAPSR